MATDLEMCNTALLLVGADEINSFEDQTRESKVCAQVYKRTKNYLLQSYPWTFSLAQSSLSLTSDDPLFEFEYVFQLPTNMLRVIKKDNIANNYRIFGDKLYTNENSVKILYQYDPGESEYPEYFARAIELRLAELLAAALPQDLDASRVFESKFTYQNRVARAIDSQQEPSPGIQSTEFALTSVRGNS